MVIQFCQDDFLVCILHFLDLCLFVRSSEREVWTNTESTTDKKKETFQLNQIKNKFQSKHQVNLGYTQTEPVLVVAHFLKLTHSSNETLSNYVSNLTFCLKS